MSDIPENIKRIYIILRSIINKIINIEKLLGIDWVVEQGVSDGWNYVKWHGGRITMKKYINVNDGSTPITICGAYYSHTTVTIPFTLVGSAYGIGNCVLGTGISAGTFIEVRNTYFGVYALGNQNSTNIRGNVWIDGFYK